MPVSVSVPARVRVQVEDFDAGAELRRLREARADVGAVVSFIGVVRDGNEGAAVGAMTLEHYPGMTERSIESILDEARRRWKIFDALVIHRIGRLMPKDQIVLVAVTGSHRGEAFDACEFIMDFLKTRAPFWKKEETASGDRWIEARSSDDEAAQRWQGQPSR